MPLSYEDWAERLFEFFFDEENDGEEILFAIDEPTLQEIYPEGGTAAGSSLAQAVASRIQGSQWLVSNVYLNMVQPWERLGRPGAHPALPLLALTVLAASRMQTGGSFAANNYYVPLRRTLDPNDVGHGPPGDFRDYIEQLWFSVEEWSTVTLEGRMGILRAESQSLRYVGLALQHAFLRASDLRHLDEFFRRFGLEPGEDLDVEPAELRRRIRAWLLGRNEPWAIRLRDACKDRQGDDRELMSHCERLLIREARRWDGRPRDPRTGRAIGQILLVVKSRANPQPGLYPKWDQRLPESQVLHLPGADPTTITRVEGFGWYKPHPLPIENLGQVLEEGLDVTGEPTNFQFAEASLYTLSYDNEIAAWASVDHITFGEPHIFVVRAEIADEVAQFLAGQAEEGGPAGHPMKPLGDDRLSDWRLIGPSRIDVRPTAGLPDALAPFLPAGRGLSLRLLGGLRIGERRNVYLRGGEPAIGLSELADPNQPLVVERAETDEPVGGDLEIRTGADEVPPWNLEPQPGEDEVPLWTLKLEPGEYIVKQGGARAIFAIVEGVSAVAGPGAGGVLTDGVSGTIAPAPAPAVRPHMVVVRPGIGSWVILGSSPDEYEAMKLPRWLKEEFREPHEPAFLTWTEIDAWLDFDPIWQLFPSSESGAGTREARLLHPSEPTTDGTSEGTDWAMQILGAELHADAEQEEQGLWLRYRERAQGR